MRVRSVLSRVLAAVVVVCAMATTCPSGARDRDLAEAADFRVRVQAALRLGRAGAQARPDLERGLRDAHPAVRVACAVALGNIGDRQAIPAIEQAMKRESFASVKSAMKDSIDKLKARAAAKAPAAPGVEIERAKYVVQLGTMRNNSGVRQNDLDGVMRDAARAKAGTIKDAFVVDGPDADMLRRASERKIPVLLLDGKLTRLTQTKARDGGLIVSAKVDISIRRVPQQTLKGMVSGNATASDDARAAARALTELQNRAVNAAVESAVSSMGAEIASLAK
jgi:hypothetical protein